LIDEAQVRGGLPGLTYTFTATDDSNSVAWTDSETIDISNSTSLLDVIRTFITQGMDVWLDTSTFELNAYKNGKGTDKSETIYFRVGSNCEEVYSDERGADIKNAFLVAYQGGYLSVTDPTSITNRRRREKLLDLKNAQSSASATTYAAAKLAQEKDPQKSISVKIYDGVGPRAFLDYDLGDYIMLDVEGTETKYRIYGIQLNWTDDGFADVVVDLNSILYDHELRMSRDLDWLLNQWETEHDADKLEVSFWANPTQNDDQITEINAIVALGTKIYVGGAFTRIGGINTNNIAVYDTATGLWDGLGGGTGYPYPTEEVFSLLVDDGNVYVGGLFSTIGGVSADSLAVWSGSAWAEVGGGVQAFYPNESLCTVRNMAISGTLLYITGLFDEADHTYGISEIASYDLDTSTWADLGTPGIVDSKGVILVDGANVYLGGDLSPYVKVWNGSSWATVGSGLDGQVY
jgi:hypothetical protein